MSQSDTQFDTQFNQYFNFDNRELQRKTRKLFKCTMTSLIRKYPEVFAYESQAQPIYILPNKLEEAKAIMKSIYIPSLYKNNTYYYYPSGQLYVKKDRNKVKFHEIYDDPHVEELKKAGNLKALKDYLNSNFSDKYSKAQLDNLAYRMLKNTESTSEVSEESKKNSVIS